MTKDYDGYNNIIIQVQKPKHTWLCKTNGNDRQQKFVTPNGQIVEARRNMQ